MSDNNIVLSTDLCARPLNAYNSIPGTLSIHIDFQKNLVCPKIPTQDIYYKRQLYTYNFGLYVLNRRGMLAYMWSEDVAKKGPSEVISCLNHFITSTDLGHCGAKTLIIWADNCTGQQKNQFLLKYLQYLIDRRWFNRIDLKFLSQGHSFASCDRCFGLIELKSRRLEKILMPEDWMKIAQSCRNIEVINMQQESFRDWKSYLDLIYMKPSQPRIMNTSWFNFGAGSKVTDEMEWKHSDVWQRRIHKVSAKITHRHYKRRKELTERSFPFGDNIPFAPPRLHKRRLALKGPKVNDLKAIAGSYLSDPGQKEFYMTLESL